MQCATSVDGYWLAELGPMFFSVKESGRSGIDKKKKVAEHLHEMESQMQKAQEEIEEQKLLQLKQEEALIVKQEILTPGQSTPGQSTPRRTPARIGL